MRNTLGDLDASKTFLAQYANSPILTALIEAMNAEIDPGADIDAFYDYVWNVSTAQGFGLDIWGRIVNIPREVQLLAPADYLGFEEASPDSFPFDQAPFYDGVLNPPTGMYKLSDDAYRVLIMTKALANISSFTAPSMNALLRFMFAGRGSCYVLELGGMAIQYVFNFALQPWESSVLQTASLMPRPAGVQVSVAVNTDVTVQVVLTSLSGSTWTVPSTWNSSNNTIELIGGGQSGASAAGGIGGSYAKISNLTLTPGSVAAYQIGTGGAASTGATKNNGGDTWFSSISTVLAKGGGSASSNVGTVIHSGGVPTARGGGGAAGPNGDGISPTSSTGGAGDAGHGGAGGVAPNNGSSGTEWGEAGSGGGGGGGISASGEGGGYGGGGGGQGTGGSKGAQGVIVITYTT